MSAGLAGRDVALYVDDDLELAVLEPIGAALARRGARVRLTRDFAGGAEVGLYACHANRFFDFERGRWRRPPSAFSVMALHDFGQAGGLGWQFFVEESWEVFDLGLLPGPSWMSRFSDARGAGAPGPRLGMAEVGWTKLDAAAAPGFAAEVQTLRARLELDRRRSVLLACSWSDARQLRDTVERLDPATSQLVVKYPASSPPPAASPWHERLTAAYEELQRAKELAAATPGVVVAADDVDIARLLASVDVVLSNGSNVLYEAVLLGVPGVSITDWVHPAGRDGSQLVAPRVELPGVLSGGVATLEVMLELVTDPRWVALVAAGADDLVAPSTRGYAGELAADAVVAGLGRSAELGPGGAEPRGAAPGAPGSPASEVAALREALEAADAREARAREQLAVYERRLGELER